TATGERDMERLGGLIHRLPVTAAAMLVGAAAISALPPLNGFISEWLTFQAILAGVQLPQWLLKFAVPVVGAMLALSAAFAAVCFVKLYGIAFLGRPRSDAAAPAVELDTAMSGPIAALALLCVIVGVVPGLAIAAVAQTLTERFPGAPLPFGQSSLLWLVPLAREQSSYSGLIVLVAVVILMIVIAWTVHRFASARLRRAPAWDCGFPDP